MSWDISIMKFSRQFESVADIPDDEKLQVLGTRSSVRETISSIFQGTNWSGPARGVWNSHSGSIEFNLGENDPSEGVRLQVRAGKEVAPLIVELCLSNGWQGFDYSSGDFIEKSEAPESGHESWSSYRDQVIGSDE
ncbi:hypothetical protein GCM10011613_20670 [Cellvibrio zantedeschiae]|uniref:Uncharacterized protein n=1 Tax=Cellvibrio zantedeschiae TaxID=1237077 RepID=A0ABQ3B532_9GAMM|nr:hypothetical protein [Cellvibrio zantedeschiae]GGY75051.1 hypothetical protein GCM10011613_20670 [Cellvibrio zantedeschiae]